jgi:hypothetical protein
MTLTDVRALLARAENPTERKQAVATAMSAGMPLHEIEELLDWADAIRAGRAVTPVPSKRSIFSSFVRLAHRGGSAK